MSVNTSHTPDGRGVLLYQGEIILLFSQSVDMEFEANDNAVFNGRKFHGYIYLTSHRVIFINTKSGNLRSFSMPFFCMRNVKLEQPIFGANYMKGTAISQPGGNYEGDVVWRTTFPKGGCIHFGQALIRANDTAGAIFVFDRPPAYEAPTTGYREMPPSYYYQNNFQGYNYAGNVFNDVPTNVYVYDQPPPYPGMNGYNGQQPPPNAAPCNPTYPANGNPPYPASGNPNFPASNPPYPAGDVQSNQNAMYPDLHRRNPTAPPSEPPPPYEAPALPPKV